MADLAAWKRRLGEERERRNRGGAAPRGREGAEGAAKSNRGVEGRAERDRKELVLKDAESAAGREALLRKAAEYERIMRGERDDELLEAAAKEDALVDFVPKRYNALVREEECKEKEPKESFFTEFAVRELFVDLWHCLWTGLLCLVF